VHKCGWLSRPAHDGHRGWVQPFKTPSLSIIHHSTVVPFEAVRSLGIPPPPRHTRVGGRAANPKICQPHFPFQATENHCCDSVAMCGFSNRCRLKSLRDERWRRPLNPKNWDGWMDGWLELLSTIEKGRETEPPDRACRILFSDLPPAAFSCLPRWSRPSMWCNFQV
jgi:hypothetical protein